MGGPRHPDPLRAGPRRRGASSTPPQSAQEACTARRCRPSQHLASALPPQRWPQGRPRPRCASRPRFRGAGSFTWISAEIREGVREGIREGRSRRSRRSFRGVGSSSRICTGGLPPPAPAPDLLRAPRDGPTVDDVADPGLRRCSPPIGRPSPTSPRRGPRALRARACDPTAPGRGRRLAGTAPPPPPRRGLGRAPSRSESIFGPDARFRSSPRRGLAVVAAGPPSGSAASWRATPWPAALPHARATRPIGKVQV